MSLETKSFYPSLQRNVTPTSCGSQLVSYSSDIGSKDGPILMLIHGYPQSAFIWRHIVPSLVTKYSVFIPELPGYGISSPVTTGDHSKKSVGTSILEALRAVFNVSPSAPRKVILGGHDRGGRICHRLGVDATEFLAVGIKPVAAIILDIVPTKVQYDIFSNPTYVKGYFHWPFLANVDVAVKMLSAFGGGKWVRHQLTLAGNEKGMSRIQADGAVDVYAALFEKEETLRGSCDDYAAAAGEDYKQQVEDQKAGRKLGLPTLVMVSAAGVGARSNAPEVWKDWVQEGTELSVVLVGEGVGHFLPEEAHDIVLEKMVEFLGKDV
ncbi:alpha/beta hydrolase [Apodospora peruviana]|uniref:Alpha/beta hydrolase n=1 Tax=Apodospora peruviana TaxID=516989 RepID=A0AAE0HTK6_9PEZI|nr:alpha/beta hydrolase [Apodospora peruviana]